MKSIWSTSIGLVASLLCAGPVHAIGVVPETSVVIVDAADGESTIGVKNTDATPTLLYTSIVDLPEDRDDLVLVTQPMSRVEAGRTQLVRFVLHGNTPIKVQRLKRVTFEGIPPLKPGEHVIKTVVRQDLPLIIHPRGLARDEAPWKHLTWSIEGDDIVARNDSPYVVRLAQRLEIMPRHITVTLPKSYVLPGETLHARASGPLADATHVRLFPATVYGFSVKHFDAPLASAQGRGAASATPVGK